MRARLKWKLMSEPENTPPAPEAPETEAREFPLPPVSFEFLTLSLRTQAEMQLGLLDLGDGTERPKPDLRLARHTIDLMAMLQEKTRGNLTMEEQRLLDNSLTELRFRYLQAAEESPQKG
jgi:hypothetical protein